MINEFSSSHVTYKATFKVEVPIHHRGYLEQPKFYLWFLTRYFWWSMILNFFLLLQSSNSWLHISCLSGHDPKNTFIITAQQPTTRNSTMFKVSKYLELWSCDIRCSLEKPVPFRTQRLSSQVLKWPQMASNDLYFDVSNSNGSRAENSRWGTRLDKNGTGGEQIIQVW